MTVSRLCRVRRCIPNRSRVGDGCCVERRDRSGKIDGWHVTKGASRVSVDRQLLVEKLELPQRLYSLHAVRCVVWYGGQFRQGVGKDLVNFRLNPFYLLFQALRRRVLKGAVLLLLLCGDRAQTSGRKAGDKSKFDSFHDRSSIRIVRVTTSTQA